MYGNPSGYAPTPSGPTPGYEFNTAENEVIKRAGARATAWGAVSVVVGGFQLISLVSRDANTVALLVGLATALASIVVGLAFIGVGSSFKLVVNTQGNDIHNLMGAIKNLDRAFTTQLLLVVVAFVIGAVAASAARS